MNHLLRGLAPISDSGWQLLDDEAKQRLAPALAARGELSFHVSRPEAAVALTP